eukprot:Stramenopile-MAST_4_protein_3157
MSKEGPGSSGQKNTKQKEIYDYHAAHTVYGLGWSARRDKKFRLAVGSFIEEYNNKVEIIQLLPDADGEDGSFQPTATFDHPYPTTKIMWMPKPELGDKDLLATTGDYLRIWAVDDDNEVRLQQLLNNSKNSEYCAPLTAFDWNETDRNLVVTSSIDTTCTVWDVETAVAKTQLIAHDKEVYDVAFSRGKDVFGSVGADGSVRMFDLRNLEHSSIIYEAKDSQPLLRLAWNKQDPNYLATLSLDDNRTIILDVRIPSVPVAELKGHQACVNAIEWAPHSSCHICTAGDDSKALIWDLSHIPQPIEDPILAYGADGEINQLKWSAAQPDWVGITFGKRLQILRV